MRIVKRLKKKPDSVRKFQGAVICVSHDQFFVNKVSNEAWVVSGGRVRQVESFDAYQREQMEELKNQIF